MLVYWWQGSMGGGAFFWLSTALLPCKLIKTHISWHCHLPTREPVSITTNLPHRNTWQEKTWCNITSNIHRYVMYTHTHTIRHGEVSAVYHAELCKKSVCNCRVPINDSYISCSGSLYQRSVSNKSSLAKTFTYSPPNCHSHKIFF